MPESMDGDGVFLLADHHADAGAVADSDGDYSTHHHGGRFHADADADRHRDCALVAARPVQEPDLLQRGASPTGQDLLICYSGILGLSPARGSTRLPGRTWHFPRMGSVALPSSAIPAGVAQIHVRTIGSDRSQQLTAFTRAAAMIRRGCQPASGLHSLPTIRATMRSTAYRRMEHRPAVDEQQLGMG